MSTRACLWMCLLGLACLVSSSVGLRLGSSKHTSLKNTSFKNTSFKNTPFKHTPSFPPPSATASLQWYYFAGFEQGGTEYYLINWMRVDEPGGGSSIVALDTLHWSLVSGKTRSSSSRAELSAVSSSSSTSSSSLSSSRAEWSSDMLRLDGSFFNTTSGNLKISTDVVQRSWDLTLENLWTMLGGEEDMFGDVEQQANHNMMWNGVAQPFFMQAAVLNTSSLPPPSQDGFLWDWLAINLTSAVDPSDGMGLDGMGMDGGMGGSWLSMFHKDTYTVVRVLRPGGTVTDLTDCTYTALTEYTSPNHNFTFPSSITLNCGNHTRLTGVTPPFSDVATDTTFGDLDGPMYVSGTWNATPFWGRGVSERVYLNV